MAKAKHPKQPNDSKASRWSSIGWFLWLVGPPLLAAAITFSDRLAPPTPLPTATALPAALPNVTARRLPAATPLPSANDPSAPSDLHDGRECSFWASDGECERNSAFMLSRCARSCLKLGHARQAYDQRCPAPAARTPALLPGEMPRTFERIVDDFAALGPEMLSHDPPIVLFRNFLADDEAEAFIAHGAGRYSRSLGVGLTAEGKMGEVKTEIRTSSHGWCQHEACLRDPRVERATARVANVTRTGEEHFEFAQLVYYHACTPAPSVCPRVAGVRARSSTPHHGVLRSRATPSLQLSLHLRLGCGSQATTRTTPSAPSTAGTPTTSPATSTGYKACASTRCICT